jgi:hypothetical protein
MKIFFTLLLCCFVYRANAQLRYNNRILDTLEHLSLTHTPSAYFARLYYGAIEKTNEYAKDQPENVRQFIFGFEAYFCQRFIQAHDHHVHDQPQDFSWQFYYSDSNFNELQYDFIGMNAHINGDMWQALKDKYCYDSLKKYKRPLIKFQKALNVYFDSMYVTSKKYKRIRHLHHLSLGIDKLIGRHMILQWRKRQVNMAMLFYTDPEACKRKWAQLQKKMLRWNNRSIRWIR